MRKNVLQLPQNPCPFCKRNEATQLCDFVVDYSPMTFFSPRIGGIEPPRPSTCDNQICKACAQEYNGHEFCPVCQKIHQMVRKEHKRVGKHYLQGI